MFLIYGYPQTGSSTLTGDEFEFIGYTDNAENARKKVRELNIEVMVQETDMTEYDMTEYDDEELTNELIERELMMYEYRKVEKILILIELNRILHP